MMPWFKIKINYLTFFNLIKLIIRQHLCKFWQLRFHMDSENFTSGFVNYLQVIFQNKWKKGIWKQQKHHQALSMFGYSTPLLWTLNREISWKGYIWNLCVIISNEVHKIWDFLWYLLVELLTSNLLDFDCEKNPREQSTFFF